MATTVSVAELGPTVAVPEAQLGPTELVLDVGPIHLHHQIHQVGHHHHGCHDADERSQHHPCCHSPWKCWSSSQGPCCRCPSCQDRGRVATDCIGPSGPWTASREHHPCASTSWLRHCWCSHAEPPSHGPQNGWMQTWLNFKQWYDQRYWALTALNGHNIFLRLSMLRTPSLYSQTLNLLLNRVQQYSQSPPPKKNESLWMINKNASTYTTKPPLPCHPRANQTLQK